MEVGLSTPAGGEPISAILLPASGDPGFQQNVRIMPQNPSTISVPPGRYFACAVAAPQPWMLMQNSAVRKALESRCETVDAPEGGKVRVELPLIPNAELKQLLEKADQ